MWRVTSQFKLMNQGDYLRKRAENPDPEYLSGSDVWQSIQRAELPDANGIYSLDMSYADARKTCAHQKWDAETSNGYRCVYTERSVDRHGRLQSVTYYMLSWGSRPIVLCKMARIRD